MTGRSDFDRATARIPARDECKGDLSKPVPDSTRDLDPWGTRPRIKSGAGETRNRRRETMRYGISGFSLPYV